MTRIACLMMQREESLLLRPWLLYHGYLFGFENLFVFDNGSRSAPVMALLAEFADLGVHIDATRRTAEDFAGKGEIIGYRIREFQASERYDIAVPLDCDEFLAIRGDQRIACHRSEILAELARIDAGGVACRTQFCLDNRPGHLDLFRYIEHVKSVVVVREFLGIDHGFHEAVLAEGQSFGATALMHIHLHFKPFSHVLAGARNKLAPYVDVDDKAALDAYDGVGEHLTKYFRMTEEQFYGGWEDPPATLALFRGLTALLGALTDLDELRSAWESGRRALPPTVMQIDLDRMTFADAAYLEANPDLSAADTDPFQHFLSAGYLEGRRLEDSPAGEQEVAERLARFRDVRRDGVTGYSGVALALNRLGRSEEADALLLEAILHFGETATLLREHALLAMYCNDNAQAALRWQRFRHVFADESDGYHYGGMASRLAGAWDEAELAVQSGLRVFPEHLGIAIEQAELAAARSRWVEAKQHWDALVSREPDNNYLRERAAESAFQLALGRLENFQDAHLMDGPVPVSMSPEEIERALQRHGFHDQKAMRAFFMTFESLGHSCEFGLVQRHFGAEPISLFRWSSIHLPKLIEGLTRKFAEFDDPANMYITQAGREYILRDLTYATVMHTFTYATEADAQQVLGQQTRRAAYLKRKLLAELELGEKIFVHLDDDTGSIEQIEQLHRAMRVYGSGRLLYVRIDASGTKAGLVEPLGDGLLLGYIQRQGRGADGAWNINFDDWLAVCAVAARHPVSVAPDALPTLARRQV